MCYHIEKQEPMKRTNFYFPQEMLDRLKAASEKTGKPMSVIIREAVERSLLELQGIKHDTDL